MAVLYGTHSMLRPGRTLALDKLESPVSQITFLSTEVDTLAGELHLLDDKLHRILHTLAWWWAGKRVNDGN